MGACILAWVANQPAAASLTENHLVKRAQREGSKREAFGKGGDAQKQRCCYSRQKCHGLKASFTGALIPAFFP
ncbi:hypothetical protein C2845_PM08G23760 [Panicum miliaceum]|uniref:Uncharacterized protein n=1 Tax=Panicum miliaceum TaxID=4540 RepID=A0A3L6R0X1_PANMI|nr:hypothetical protein C2845_PM08G23760 [Panicum miliaceum]